MADGPLMDRLADEVRFVKSRYSHAKKLQIVDDTVQIYRAMGKPVPEFLDKLMHDHYFKRDLADSRGFCKRAGVSYANIDSEWDTLRAAVARYFMAAALMLRRGDRRAA